MEQLVDGNSAFAFDLYQAIKDEPGNLFYSPYSISLALAMTYAGARGQTESQMAATMHYTLPQSELHPQFKTLAGELTSRGEGARGIEGQPFRLNIANSIWAEKTYTFLREFLDLLDADYQAGIRLVDFKNAPDPSRIEINQWVEDRTEDKIKDLIAPGLIDPMTRLVLVNAVYFNAAWAHQFKEAMTRDGEFKPLQGQPITVPMMEQTESFTYAQGDGWQAAALPYDGYELSMVVLLPEQGKFEEFQNSLTADQVKQIIGELNSAQVHLTMPKFRTESEFLLSDTLMSLGMTDAFSDADFSGMDGTRFLNISEVVHKAFVDVDENGTEAAAATAVIMRATGDSEMPEIVEFKVDRPFIFLIRDNATGAILFVGRMLDPSH